MEEKDLKSSIDAFFINSRNYLVNETMKLYLESNDDSIKIRALELLNKLL